MCPRYRKTSFLPTIFRSCLTGFRVIPIIFFHTDHLSFHLLHQPVRLFVTFASPPRERTQAISSGSDDVLKVKGKPCLHNGPRSLTKAWRVQNRQPGPQVAGFLEGPGSQNSYCHRWRCRPGPLYSNFQFQHPIFSLDIRLSIQYYKLHSKKV
jgi:hypothetical protein